MDRDNALDFENLLEEKIGRFGLYQKCMFVLLLCVSVTVAFQSFIHAFTGVNPDVTSPTCSSSLQHVQNTTSRQLLDPVAGNHTFGLQRHTISYRDLDGNATGRSLFDTSTQAAADLNLDRLPTFNSSAQSTGQHVSNIAASEKHDCTAKSKRTTIVTEVTPFVLLRKKGINDIRLQTYVYFI